MTIRNSFPDVRPALNLDFANTKRLDPRITFARGSTGTYVDEFGVIKTAASNEARFDHDSDGNSLGLLIEESRTNLHLQSQDFSAWAVDGVTTTSNSGSAPDGTTTANLFQETTATSNHYSFRSDTSVTSGTTYTFSVFLKKGSGATAPDWVSLRFSGNGFVGGSAAFNLSTGVVGTTANLISSGITELSGGWYRCYITEAADETRNSGGLVVFTNNQNTAGLPSYTGQTTSDVYAWGAQIEAGAFPTSYIPTTSSTATRSADVASISNAFSTTAFTIINEPFGSASGSDTLQILGAGSTPIRKTSVYDRNLTQTQINAVAGVTDEFWRWRVLGSSFALPSFTTDGQVTVDWGDGTVETLTTSEHTFSNGDGYHEIGFRLDSGTYFKPDTNNNATHKDKVISAGPTPTSMIVDAGRLFSGCSNLKAVDGTFVTTGIYVNNAFNVCSNLNSIPLIDTSGATIFTSAWDGCSSLTSFPLIDTSSATTFYRTWRNCSSLTSFPLIDSSEVTTFFSAWSGCNSLTSFPALDTSNVTNFYTAWFQCSNLTSFPVIDTSQGQTMSYAWYSCQSLTSFPSLDFSSATTFLYTWLYCYNLANFPAGLFDNTTTTDFRNAFGGCALTAQSIENILVSIDTANQSTGTLTLGISGGTNAGYSTWSSAAQTALSNLQTKGWTVNYNP